MGGLIQLAAYGNQDVFLTGNPQITFWKMVFKRHTNFALESIEQPLTGKPDFGSVCSVTLPKNTADLVHKCHVQVTLENTDRDSNSLKENFGLKLLKRATITIDGMDIDSQTGEWMEYWNEYTLEHEKEEGYKEMIGNSSSFTTNSMEENEKQTTILIPLNFFFCQNPGLSLPIHALQYSEVKIRLEFNEINKCVNGNITIEKCSLFVDYVYLDIDEKKQILQSNLEFLITQVQDVSSNISSKDGDVRLDFIHPVKEMVWCFKDGNDKILPMKSGYITMNGSQKRASERPGKYYRLIQPYNHHLRIPKINIYMYSFALKPEETQPSGSCNFSRLDNSHLHYTLNDNINDPKRIRIYATNTNLLRIMGGKGALAYA